MNKKLMIATAIVFVLGAAVAAAGTLVPGHEKLIIKNGIPKGEVVGNFAGYRAYDASGAFYFDIGGSIVEGSVLNSETDLDQETLTTCDYRVNFQGFLNMNTGALWGGWFRNHIQCSGYDYPEGKTNFQFLFVDQYDKRYDGDPDRAIFETEINVFEYTDVGKSGLSRDEIEDLVIFPARL